MPDAPRPSAPLSNARPANARPADAPPMPSPGVPPRADQTAPNAATGTPAEEARSPDEYLETPGSHRRPDGAATDVGA